MKIQPLSKETLEDAINLVNHVFPLTPLNTQGDELADPNFRASLDTANYQDFLDKMNITNLEYWVAVDDKGKVIGTTGLYDYKTKEENKERKIGWMGWTTVDENYRRQGIGTTLIQFVIDEAKKRGYKNLMLYNSNSPIVEAANRIYERAGFTKKQEGKFSVKGEDGKEVLYDMYFWNLDLTTKQKK